MPNLDFEKAMQSANYDIIFVANIFLDDQNEYFSGGAEIHLLNICQTLNQNWGNSLQNNSENNLENNSEKIKKPKILIIQKGKNAELITKDGLDILKIQTKDGFINTIFFEWKLANVLSKVNSKIVHFNYIGLESFVKKQKNTIYSTTFHGTCWDFPTFEFPQKYIQNNWKQKIGSKLVKWNYIRQQKKALKWFDKILSVDTSLTRFAQMFLYELSTKIDVAYNFVDLTKFRPSEIPFESPKFTILYPRNISFARGVHLLVPIANYIKAQNIDFVIKMVGAGFEGSQMSGYQKTLHAEIVSNNLEKNFEFVGRISHQKMPELFQNCHIVTVPTYFSEGTSLSCLEAMATKKLVVVSNIGGLSDLVIDGHNGLISKPTAEQIAQNIILAYNLMSKNPEEIDQMTKNAYEIVTKNNSLVSWQEKVSKFFGK